MVQTLRERLTLALIALLPLHALAVTVLTKIIEGPGQPPIGILAVWKEGLLALILFIALYEVLKKFQVSGFRFQVDYLDWLIVALAILSIVVTAFMHHDWKLYAFGFRYDFIPLLAFVILRRVNWSEQFFTQIQNVILIVASLVAAYGIISFFLPASFFAWLGYSDLHSLYIPGGPLAPFQQIGEMGLRRIQSTFSGPNQLGIWMLLPIGILFAELLVSRLSSLNSRKKLLPLLLFGVALLLTFSRAAWIGAFAMLCVAFWPVVRTLPRNIVAMAGGVLLIAGIAVTLLFPTVILRFSSTSGHIKGPLEAIQTMIEHPFGKGLGTAGPASNRVSDACVQTEDASWAASHPELCVFVKGLQVQPADRECNCPFLPENWYLQIGVEMGWAGLVLYVGLVIVVLRRLVSGFKFQVSSSAAKPETCKPACRQAWPANFLVFVGVSTAALFLHAWEDSAIAYAVWVLIATML